MLRARRSRIPIPGRRRRAGPPISPPAALMALYAGCILIGAVLLNLPIASGPGVGWSEALFTAASAVTVTGLSVIDVASELTLFGKIVLLALIEVGGLGLMTFAALIMWMLGLPVGYAPRIMLREDLNQTPSADLLAMMRMILRFALIAQGAGALALFPVFALSAGAAEGAWQAVFHSISAFNNAGFALFPDSLTAWVGDPVVNIVVPALIVAGGLGFPVVEELKRERRWRALSLHSKIMIAGTVWLLVGSTILFALLEWSNPATLGALPWWDRLQASWFQAVTFRTAGFNTIDMGGLTDAGSLFAMALMMIGAGSASTGGGIKVTTFAVLLLATHAFLRRRAEVEVFGRRLAPEQVMKVLALTMISVLLAFAAMFALLLMHEGDFLDCAFETISALGTVGVSRGITGDLDLGGRIVILLAMFVGRVGPLTLGFLLATRAMRRISYPAGAVYLG